MVDKYDEFSIRIHKDDYIKVKEQADKDRRTIKATLSMMIDIALTTMGK